MEINDLPDKEIKIMVIMMLTKLRRRMNELSGNFNKDRKYKKVSNGSHRIEKCNN